jgi:F-type H+-transporting ATPase subunit epsilon
MAEPILLRVLTEAGVAIEDQAVSVIAPGEIGYLGMLRNHAPLVTTLQPGTLSWKRAGGQRRAVRVGTGLLEISHNRCTLLTSTVAEPSPPEPAVH